MPTEVELEPDIRPFAGAFDSFSPLPDEFFRESSSPDRPFGSATIKPFGDSSIPESEPHPFGKTLPVVQLSGNLRTMTQHPFGESPMEGIEPNIGAPKGSGAVSAVLSNRFSETSLSEMEMSISPTRSF